MILTEETLLVKTGLHPSSLDELAKRDIFCLKDLANAGGLSSLGVSDETTCDVLAMCMAVRALLEVERLVKLHNN